MSENHWSKLQRDAAHILASAKGRNFLAARCTPARATLAGQPWRGQLVGNLGGNPGKGMGATLARATLAGATLAGATLGATLAGATGQPWRGQPGMAGSARGESNRGNPGLVGATGGGNPNGFF